MGEEADLLPCLTVDGGMLGVFVEGCVPVGANMCLSCVWMAGCTSIGVLVQ